MSGRKVFLIILACPLKNDIVIDSFIEYRHNLLCSLHTNCYSKGDDILNFPYSNFIIVLYERHWNRTVQILDNVSRCWSNYIFVDVNSPNIDLHSKCGRSKPTVMLSLVTNQIEINKVRFLIYFEF